MVLYEAKDLKEQFKELDRLQDLTLIPLFDRVSSAFFKHLNHNPSKYDIADGRMTGYGEYILVVDGKLVSLDIHRADIDASADYDEFWWMVDSMTFGYNKKGAMKMYEGAKNFVKKQNLNGLLKEAKQELEKGKTHHLAYEMKFFYLR